MARGESASAVEPREVVVVGAGLAGLTVARTLRRLGHAPLVLEREPVPGGRVRTADWSGARIELGGVFLMPSYRGLVELAGGLGLGEELVAPPERLRAAVRRGGRWHELDFGRARTLGNFSALGWRDRWSVVRAALPALRPRTSADPGDVVPYAGLDDRSAGTGMSADAVEYYAGGPFEFLWGCRPDEASLALLAAQLRVFHGRPLEVSTGTGAIVQRMWAQEHEVPAGVVVERVEEAGDRVLVHSRRDGPPLTYAARAVVIAAPAPEAAALWSDAPAEIREFLRSVRYSRIDSLYLRTRDPWRRVDRRGNPLYMEIVPPAERGSGLLGGVLPADRWAETGGLLLAAAGPGTGAEELGDEALADRLQAEVEELHPELRGQVVDRRVLRTDRFVPMFVPGYVRHLAAVRRRLGGGRVDLAGDYLSAPWLEGALRSGEQAAARVDAFLRRPQRRASISAPTTAS